MRKRTRSYFEPWVARQSTLWKQSFAGPPPVDDPDVLYKWHTAKARAERDADWLVWGSGMFSPTVPEAFVTGDPEVMDDTHIITRVGKVYTEIENPPHHGEIAARVADCVNALAGVGDPVPLVAATRAYLNELVTGGADGADNRAVSLLARWIPTTFTTSHDVATGDEPP